MADRFYTQIQREEIGRTFEGRPVINTGSEINGGVYIVGLDSSERSVNDDPMEATVVDPLEYDDIQGYDLWDIKEEAEERCSENFGEPLDVGGHNVAESVHQVIEDNIEYDDSYAQSVMEDHGKTKLELQSFFTSQKKGICRHQSLVAASVLELLHEEDKIQGTGIINQNLDRPFGGHMWAEYVEEGRRYVVDPAQGYSGGPVNNPQTWDYHPETRVEDIDPEKL